MSGRDRSRHALRATLFVSAGAYVLLTHPVWNPAGLGIEIDPAWRAALHQAWAEGWQHGTKIVFNHGPFGFVGAFVYQPATFATSVAINLGLAALGFAALWRIALRESGSALAATGVAVVVFDGAASAPDAGFVVLASLPLFLVFGVGGWNPREARGRKSARLDERLLHGLAIALALTSLIKHTYALACLPSLLAAALGCWRDGRRPRFLVSYGISLLALWGLAGQSYARIPDFVLGASQVVAGFSEAMSRPGPASEVAWLAAAALLVLASITRLWAVRLGRHALLPSIALTALVLLLWKAAVVRQDLEHLPTLVVGLVSLAAIASCGAARLLRERGHWGTVALTGLGLALAVLGGTFVLEGRAATAVRTPLSQLSELSHTPERIARAVRAVTHPEALRERYETSRAAIRRRVPLPPLEGEVDVYPNYLSIALAHDLDYTPRPALQSYSAYTRTLLELDRAQIAGPRAPEHLLLTLFAIDGRLPALEDGPSWPWLLTRYRIQGTTPPFMRLRREARPRAFELHPLTERDAVLGERIALPSTEFGSALWAEIELRTSSSGRLLRALFRPPRVWLELRTDDHQLTTARFIPELGRAGFLLSPLVEKNEDFRRLATHENRAFFRRRAVRELRLVIGNEFGSGWAYERDVHLSLSVLRFDPMPPEDGQPLGLGRPAAVPADD